MSNDKRLNHYNTKKVILQEKYSVTVNKELAKIILIYVICKFKLAIKQHYFMIVFSNVNYFQPFN